MNVYNEWVFSDHIDCKIDMTVAKRAL